MAEQNSTLATFYKSWENYQALLIQALSPLSSEQLALRSAPNLCSAAELAAHIVGTRAGWFHQLMGEGGDDIAAMASWGRSNMPVPDAAGLVAGLQATWRMMQQALARWTPEDMEHVYTGTRGGRDYALSRQWVIWHLIEHGLHHGGELSLTLGMHGIHALDL